MEGLVSSNGGLPVSGDHSPVVLWAERYSCELGASLVRLGRRCVLKGGDVESAGLLGRRTGHLTSLQKNSILELLAPASWSGRESVESSDSERSMSFD